MCLLLIAEVSRCKKLLLTRYEKSVGTNLYLKPINIGKFYLFILYFQLTYTIELPLQKYNTSSSQLPTIKSFNEETHLL